MLKVLKNMICCASALAISITAMAPAFAAETNQTVNLAEDTSFEYEIQDAYFSGGKLMGNVKYNGSGEGKAAKIIIAKYVDNVITDVSYLEQEIKGDANFETNYSKSDNETVKLYIWNNTNNISPLGKPFPVVKNQDANQTYTARVASGITGGTVKIVKPAGEVEENKDTFFVTADTKQEGGTVYTDTEDILVSCMFDGKDGKSQKNLEVKFEEKTDPETGEVTTAPAEDENGEKIIEVASATINGVECCDYLSVSLSGTPSTVQSLPQKGDCSVINIETKKAGKLTLYYRWQYKNGDENNISEMQISPVDEDGNLGVLSDGKVGERKLTRKSPDGNFGYGIKTFELDAKSRYLMWAYGSTGILFGYTFEPAESAE